MRTPLWLRLGYTIWACVWFGSYVYLYPPEHFLWLCHIGNAILVVAVWRASPLLFSWQAVSLLVADLLFIVDVVGRLLLGWHPIGGTEYMFNAELPLAQRGLSLFHIVLPFLLIWSLWRFGYDRRAIWCQLATLAVLYPLSYVLGSEADNINWVRGPFGKVQHTVSPLAYLFVAMIVYPLVLFVPSHLIFLLVAPRRRDNARPPAIDAAGKALNPAR